MTVQPHKALHETAGVEKGVAGVVHLQRAAIEARARAIGGAERQLLGIAHGQRVDLPTCQRLAVQRDLLRNALALAANYRAEVHAARVLHQDVELRLRSAQINVQWFLFQPPVERSQQLAVCVDLRVVVEFVKNQVARDRALNCRPVENVAVRLVEVLHRHYWP